MKLTEMAAGVYAIAVTPFDPAGAVDFASIDSMMDFYIGCGVTGLTILGVLGEAPKLDAEESLAVIRRVLAKAGALPIIVGVSAPGFAAMRTLAHGAMELGAAGVMIAPPSNLRTDDQIVGYYRQAVKAIGADIPFVIQDYPLTFQVVMTPKVIREIVRELPSCVMLKHEDWPGLEKISALRGFQADGSMRPISILCGNGGLFLDFEMERGADGAMTGYAFPDMLVDVVRYSRSGERQKGARSLRRASAAAALRAAAGRRPRGPQICLAKARRHRVGQSARAFNRAVRASEGGGGFSS